MELRFSRSPYYPQLELVMPFFKDAQGIQINAGKFCDVAGSQTTVDNSQHVYREGSRVNPTAETGASESHNNSSSTSRF